MNIGIYSPYLDTLGGGERYMLTIASCLEEEHTVSLFWRDKEILEKANEQLGIALNKTSVVPSMFSPSTRMIPRLRALGKYDVLFFLSDGSIPVSLSKKMIIHFQQPFMHTGGGNFLNRLKLSLVKHVICNSDFTKEFIDAEYHVNSTVVYPPVPVHHFSPRERKKDVILSVGRFHPAKKQDVLIHAFSLLRKREPGLKLVLAGGLSSQMSDYFNSLLKMPHEDVEFQPNIPFTTLKALYEESLVYWHAAGYGESPIEHPQRMEHFGIAPVEAMSAGCIPLLYHGGGLREIITHGTNGFLWGSEQELVDQTIYLLQNPSYVNALRARAVERSRLFNQDAFCKRIHTLIS